MAFIELHKVTKIYSVGEINTYALNEVDLQVEEGELLVVLGPSGSGKSTLLNVLSGLDQVSSGKIIYQGEEISRYRDKELTHFRRENIGFIFQSYQLLSNLTVRENVEVGANIAPEKIDIDDLLRSIGIYEERHKFPYQLSGGQQQRVSIARALAKSPKILFCDEPTGALDEEMGKNVLGLLQEVNEKYNTTLMIVTHNPAISQLGSRSIQMNSGRIVKDLMNEKRKRPEEITWG